MASRDAAARRSNRLANLRLVLFAVAVGLLVWAESVAYGIPQLLASGAVLAAFGGLVVVHARAKAHLRRCELRLAVNADGIQRARHAWGALPVPPDPSTEAHPYAADLDLFGSGSLAQLLGTVRSTVGRQTLNRWLLHPSSGREIRRRQEAVEELRALREFREGLELEGRLQEHGAEGMDRFLAWAEGEAAPASPAPVRAWARVTAVATPALVVLHLAGVLAYAWWIVPVAVNVAVTAVRRKRIHGWFEGAGAREVALQSHARMISWCGSLACTAPALREATDAFHGSPVAAPRELHRLHSLFALADLRLSMVYPVMQGLALWDEHVLAALRRWRRRNGSAVRRWLEALGAVEALSAFAGLRDDRPEWCVPEIVEDGRVGLWAGGLGHPLLRDDVRVDNDITLGPPGTFLLVTGSNMSGKSTLLRAIGTNVALALAGAPACCRVLSVSPVRIATSMRTRDSLERGVSSFMAALERVKLVVEAARRRGEAPVLFLLDEILQGTNSAERMTAVRGVVGELASLGAIGAVSTHDLALADAPELQEAKRAVHFTETVGPGAGAVSMTFDYLLRPGLATSGNALRLMELMGLRPPGEPGGATRGERSSTHSTTGKGDPA